MSWGLTNPEDRIALQVQLAVVRRELYRFNMLIAHVKHSEKGPRLQELSDQANATLVKIDFQLNR